METLEHNGAVFTKATVLAKRLNYTTDYIGQLCRAGKVEAKLVGRAWFVREDTLLHHKADRYKTVRPAEIISKHNAFTYDVPVHVAEKVQVYPRLSKHTHRNFTYQTASAPVQFAPLGVAPTEVSRARYEADTETLHPDFHYLKNVELPTEEIEEVAVAPEPAQKISVRNETSRPKKLYFEPLAEVSLSGSLKIQNLDAEGSYASSEPVTVEDIPVAAPKRIVPSIPQNQLRTKAAPVTNPLPPPLVARVTRPTSFTPKIVVEPTPRAGIPFFIPVVFVVSVTATVLMLSLSSFVESDGVFFNQSLRFSAAQVIDSLSSLR